MGQDRNARLSYLPAEAKARVDVDSQLEAAGWTVQDRDQLDLYASQGVAVREFTLKEDHGRVDYLLVSDRQAAGTIEAKPAGTTLAEVELQTSKYITGVPEGLPPPSVIAAEIVDDLEAALEEFRQIADALNTVPNLQLSE